MAGNVVVISGGVGGAKLALGLYKALPDDTLTAIVNTGDDFTHCGLRICPDIDTTLYTLADLANTEQGWGRTGESWQCLETLASLGGESWFQLGDKDIALHLLRTDFLNKGGTLSRFVARITAQLGIRARILPMSNQWVATELDTDEGRLAFQEYFVKRRCEPVVEALHYVGAGEARLPTAIETALCDDAPRAVVIAPSNPFLSVAPILAVPGMRESLRKVDAPIVAVTPVIGDAAVKGPTAKIMRELNLQPSALTVAEYYRDLIDGFVVDARDAHLCDELEIETLCTDTLMTSLMDKQRLACEVLDFADRLNGRNP